MFYCFSFSLFPLYHVVGGTQHTATRHHRLPVFTSNDKNTELEEQMLLIWVMPLTPHLKIKSTLFTEEFFVELQLWLSYQSLTYSR